MKRRRQSGVGATCVDFCLLLISEHELITDALLRLVEQGREYKNALAEIGAINAQLLAIFKQQQKKKR